MVEGIAEGVRDGAGPGEEFFLGGGVAGDVALGDTVGAHGSPLIVVAFEPDFEEVLELAVFGDVFGGKMAVVIEDGLWLGVLVVEPAGGRGFEEEVFVEEWHGSSFHCASSGVGGGGGVILRMSLLAMWGAVAKW